MAHYYTDNKDLKSQPRQITYHYYGKDLVFQSDLGVFSKDTIDYGSMALLNTFEPLQNLKILDVGCGYGTLALSLAKVGNHLTCDLVDVNSRAIELAELNAKQLGLDDVHVFISHCYENVTAKYDLIISNPPIRAGKKVVHEILSGAVEHLKPGGRIRVVIQKKQGAPSAKAKLEEVFGNCKILARDRGYYILESVYQ